MAYTTPRNKGRDRAAKLQSPGTGLGMSDRFCDIDDLHRFLIGTELREDKENSRVSQDDVAWLNRALQEAGFEPTIESISNNVKPDVALSRVLESLKCTIPAVTANDARGLDLKAKLAKVEQERDSVLEQLRRSKARLEARSERVVEVKNKILQAKHNFKSSTVSIQKEINELRLINTNLCKKGQQLRLDMRKKAIENSKIREQLGEVTCCRDTRTRKRTTTQTRRTEASSQALSRQAYLDELVTDFKLTEEALIAENEELRAAFAQVDKDLADQVDEEHFSWMFDLPYSMMRHEITEVIQRRLERLESLRTPRTGSSSSSQEWQARSPTCTSDDSKSEASEPDEN